MIGFGGVIFREELFVRWYTHHRSWNLRLHSAYIYTAHIVTYLGTDALEGADGLSIEHSAYIKVIMLRATLVV